ncbi:MAG TPA: hypothetical protein VGR43_03930 [Dehalococcoidia bacterium]|nr:hypothetical protein [Dehalococcoidia bacterium]
MPPFIAAPPGAPVYYGFPILDDVEVDGFRFGMITDFEGQADEVGDAFLVAPDNSRAGLIWEVTGEDDFDEVLPFEPTRWGVWYVTFPRPMDSRQNVRRNLEAVLPRLRPKWEAWRKRFGAEGTG